MTMAGNRNAVNPILFCTIVFLVGALAWVTLSTSGSQGQNIFENFRGPSSAKNQGSQTSNSKDPSNFGVSKTDDPNFFSFKAFFQQDLSLPNPEFDIERLKTYKPINYDGSGRPTFAAYMSTRNSTIHDPYFCGAQQLAYRLLWDPRSKSEKYPFTVFVAPFIPQDQRDLLAAAGANVVELPTVNWHSTALTDARWRDLFSKLNVWNQTDFSRVALLDTDAFPLENIDAIFDEEQSPELECNRELLNDDDRNDPLLDEMCKYVYAGVHDPGLGYKQVNGGVYVLKPSQAMHGHLLREMAKDQFDDHLAEQAFLNVAFRWDGPFPAVDMGRTWNGFIPQENEEGKLKIIHDKLWVLERMTDRNLSWAVHYFNDTWDDMLKLYESDEFETLRSSRSIDLF
jgi:alpha-N-acetylglucosamine transferase